MFAGTAAYSLGEGWSVGDSLYFAVATLTTTGTADPKLIVDRTRKRSELSRPLGRQTTARGVAR